MKIIEWMVSSVGLAAIVLALVSAPTQSAGAATPTEEEACNSVEVASSATTSSSATGTICNTCSPGGTPGNPPDANRCTCTPAGCCKDGNSVHNGVPGYKRVELGDGFYTYSCRCSC